MSPEEKQLLMATLDVNVKKSLLKNQGQVDRNAFFAEPEVYVRITSDYVSFEVPKTRIFDFVEQLTKLLGRKEVTVRYDENGMTQEQRISASSISKKLQRIQGKMINNVVTLEFGPHTLFSTGGGCMLLETDLPFAGKKKISTEFLKLCGYSVDIQSDSYSFSVANNKLRVQVD